MPRLPIRFLRPGNRRTKARPPIRVQPPTLNQNTIPERVTTAGRRPLIQFFRPGGPIRPGIRIQPPQLNRSPDPILGPPAATFDAFTGRTIPIGTSDSFLHTCSGVNRVLYVTMQFNNDPGSPVTVTYNGVGMTQIASQTGGPWVYHFRLINPASGSNTVAIAWPSTRLGAAAAVSCHGVDQTTSEDGLTTELNGDESILVPSTNTGLVLDFLHVNSNPSLTAGAGQTQRGIHLTASASIYVSSEPGTGSNVTMSWTSTGFVTFHIGHNVRGALTPHLVLATQNSQRPLSGRMGRE